MRHTTGLVTVTLIVLSVGYLALGQREGQEYDPRRGNPINSPDLPPPTMMLRTTPLKVGNEIGTAFALDYKGKSYLITARHMVTRDHKTTSDVPTNLTIGLLEDHRWKKHRATVIACKNREADEVALTTDIPKHLLFASNVEATDNYRTLIGSKIYFFGYPIFSQNDIGFHTVYDRTVQLMPMVKSGVLSAGDSSTDDARVLYFDAFNNEGFSGGPIVCMDPATRSWEIIAVVSAYIETPVKIAGQRVTATELQNSGVMVGYSIKHVLDAIDVSTIGSTSDHTSGK
jgi:hypothetical protein